MSFTIIEQATPRLQRSELAVPGATPALFEKARRIMEAMAQAAREGRAAVQLGGRLIDIANIRMAQNLLQKAEAASASGKSRQP